MMTLVISIYSIGIWIGILIYKAFFEEDAIKNYNDSIWHSGIALWPFSLVLILTLSLLFLIGVLIRPIEKIMFDLPIKYLRKYFGKYFKGNN